MNIIDFPKQYEVDWPAMVKDIERLAVKKLKEDLKTWKGDVGMRQMCVQDAADALAVCETMLEKRNWDQVQNRIWRMETAARDCVYEFIEQVAGKDFLDAVSNESLTETTPYVIV